MIIIIDIGKGNAEPFRYVKFDQDAKQVTLNGDFKVIGRFEVLEETEGLPSVIQDIE